VVASSLRFSASQGLRFEDDEGLEAAASFVKGTGSPGTGAALETFNSTDFGEVAWFKQGSVLNVQPVMKLVLPDGIGQSVQRNFLECDVDGNPATRKCHIDKYGTFHAESDFAEALPALGGPGGYEPGDVLLMASDGSGVEKATVPYSPRVAGVYSTRPGVLGTDKGGETGVDEDEVPVAVVGIVPTKVSGANGSIAVGDLLVGSETAGHAIKGTDRKRMQGGDHRQGAGAVRGQQGSYSGIGDPALRCRLSGRPVRFSGHPPFGAVTSAG
jgi:hypothetical protein